MGQGLAVSDVAARVNTAISTLRTWDRRYGVGPSQRTSGGHRRYTVADVAAIRRMQRLMASGVTTRRAAAIVVAQRDGVGGPDDTDPDIGSADSAVRALVDAVFRWDIVQIDDLVARIFALRDAASTQDDVVAIVGERLRARAFGDRAGVGAALLFDARVTRVLRGVIGFTEGADEARVVLAGAGAAGQPNELLATRLALAEAGLRSVDLGADAAPEVLDAYLAHRGAQVVHLWAAPDCGADHLRLVGDRAQVVLAGPGWRRSRRPCASVAEAVTRISAACS